MENSNQVNAIQGKQGHFAKFCKKKETKSPQKKRPSKPKWHKGTVNQMNFEDYSVKEKWLYICMYHRWWETASGFSKYRRCTYCVYDCWLRCKLLCNWPSIVGITKIGGRSGIIWTLIFMIPVVFASMIHNSFKNSDLWFMKTSGHLLTKWFSQAQLSFVFYSLVFKLLLHSDLVSSFVLSWYGVFL